MVDTGMMDMAHQARDTARDSERHDEGNANQISEQIIDGGFPRTRTVAREVIELLRVDSTNRFAERLVAGGSFCADGMTVIAAREQIAGHGRLARSWYSAPGQSFIVSFVSAVGTAVACDAELSGWLPMIAGLSTIDAMRAAMRELGLHFVGSAAADDGLPDDVMLKWPNDIVYHGKKIGGILVQMVPMDDSGHADERMAVVFGVGINLDVPRGDLPIEESTSLQLIAEPSAERTGWPSCERLSDVIAAHLVKELEQRLWTFGEGPRAYAHDLRRRVMQESYTIGRHVKVRYVDGRVETGIARDINEDASLKVLDDESGKLRDVRTGDVGVLS